jgi:hypothetical protein
LETRPAEAYRPAGDRGTRLSGWYDGAVDRDAILAFARRDWSLVAEAKTEFWREQKRDLSAAELLAIGERLRRHAQTVRPEWPSASERAEDLAVHHRVAEALRAVAIRPR